MSCVTFKTLPFDVCERILILLPNIPSLQYAIVSAKNMRDAYWSRRQLILKEVELNELDPVLPLAAALVRTINLLEKEPLQVIFDGLNNSELDSKYWNTNLTTTELDALISVNRVVRRLELLFCILYRDRSAHVSTLSEMENFTFRRAMYRVWICTTLAGGSQIYSGTRLSLENSFLDRMVEDELLEIQQALKFLDVIYRCAAHEQNNKVYFWRNVTRPSHLQPDEILACFDGKDQVNVRSGSSDHGSYIFSELDNLRSKKHIAPFPRKQIYPKYILTKTRVEDLQTCQKCHEEAHELFAENNWQFLRIHLDFNDILRCLPGELWKNYFVQNDFGSVYSRHRSLVSILHELFANRDGLETDWAKTDWLCLDCFRRFLSEKLVFWFIKELVNDGYQFKENCSDGWNCRMQVAKYHHAERYNHLCEPATDMNAGVESTLNQTPLST